ncbi:MAG: hypothetical protein V9E83_10405 [Baekduia sp.]
MDTMKVHARVLDLLDSDGVPLPGRWFHDLATGSVTYGYASSPNTFKWDAEAVTSMARDTAQEPTSNAGRELLERWASIRRMLDELDDGDPDAVLVDHDAQETTLIWEERKVAVVIEHTGEREPSSASSTP